MRELRNIKNISVGLIKALIPGLSQIYFHVKVDQDLNFKIRKKGLSLNSIPFTLTR